MLLPLLRLRRLQRAERGEIFIASTNYTVDYAASKSMHAMRIHKRLDRAPGIFALVGCLINVRRVHVCVWCSTSPPGQPMNIEMARESRRHGARLPAEHEREI